MPAAEAATEASEPDHQPPRGTKPGVHRETLTPRADWPQQANAVGFVYHPENPDRPRDIPSSHWDESVCYRFQRSEVQAISDAVETLHALCLKAVDHIVERVPELLYAFGIDPLYHDYIRTSWRRRDPYWMGRFDLGYDPETGAIKMLEYNADTPTMVIETAVFQWYWMEQVKNGTDQFNSLHDKLIEHMRDTIAPLIHPSGEALTFATLPYAANGPEQIWSDEEYQHGVYFRDLAMQAGVETRWISIYDIGYRADRGFVDLAERPIRFMHMLYPWEWMLKEQFGPKIVEDRTGFIEPIWKMLLSNKVILAVLWRLFPDHPNLLAAYLEEDARLDGSFIAKPILAREGANVRLVRHGETVEETPGTYGDGPKVYQQAMTLPSFDGNTVVVCGWTVGEDAAGMVLREGKEKIVTNDSRVVPHYFTQI
jgi:glutathionylspermidine synthase